MGYKKQRISPKTINFYPNQNNNFQSYPSTQAMSTKCYPWVVKTKMHRVVPDNIHTSPTEGILVGTPPPPKNFQFSFIFSLFNWDFGFWDPLPLGISNEHPWSRYGYFLEPYIVTIVVVFYQSWEKAFPPSMRQVFNVSLSLVICYMGTI